MRIDGNEQNYLHQARVLIVMEPRDYHPEAPEYAEREPDLILTFDQFYFARNLPMLEDLRRGDLLRFNATIAHLAVARTSYQG